MVHDACLCFLAACLLACVLTMTRLWPCEQRLLLQVLVLLRLLHLGIPFLIAPICLKFAYLYKVSNLGAKVLGSYISRCGINKVIVTWSIGHQCRLGLGPWALGLGLHCLTIVRRAARGLMMLRASGLGARMYPHPPRISSCSCVLI